MFAATVYGHSSPTHTKHTPVHFPELGILILSLLILMTFTVL